MEKSLIGLDQTDNESIKGVSDSRPANGGQGSYSYFKNSFAQRSFVDVEKKKVEDEIMEKFNIKNFSSSSSNTIHLADLGCATGPNTFFSMQNIIQAMILKFPSKTPNFQVFFNDQTSNDFNTLFQSLPPEREYFAAAVPGSFHGQLFPDSSLHFVHTSYAIHWLSTLSELQDQNSPAWNKGMIHYVGAKEEVINAYASQFAKDIKNFLNARAKELVSGGIIVIFSSGVRDDISSSNHPYGMFYNSIGSSLMDMSKEGLLNEAEIDSFNLPLYITCPKEMTKLVEKNGYFSIERMELSEPSIWYKGHVNVRERTNYGRAAIEGTFIEHFKNKELIDEMFERVIIKLSQYSDEEINACLDEKVQLFAILKRK